MTLFTDYDLGIPDDDWHRPSKSDLAAEAELDAQQAERRRRLATYDGPVVQDPWQASS